MRTFTPQAVRDQMLAVLDSWGVADDVAETTTTVLLYADLAGIDSHGISMLPIYHRLVVEGRLDVRARPRILRETSGTALLDAGDGLGHGATVRAMELALAKAQRTGVGAVAVRRSHHFGAAGYYATLAAQAGMVGVVTSTTPTRAVVPTRGTRPVLGTNPLAFAAPTTDPGRPFVLDMSTSSVALNKLKVHDYLDKPLPAGWVVDGSGQPVTDPHDAYARVRAQRDGGLTPLGGSEVMSSHKGYGLATMVQILAGALAGAGFAPRREDPSSPPDIGHFCLAVDPAAYHGREAFAVAVSEIVDTLRAQPPASPDKPVLVPGDPERLARLERTASGIPLSDTLLCQLRDVCSVSGAAFLLEGA